MTSMLGFMLPSFRHHNKYPKTDSPCSCGISARPWSWRPSLSSPPCLTRWRSSSCGTLAFAKAVDAHVSISLSIDRMHFNWLNIHKIIKQGHWVRTELSPLIWASLYSIPAVSFRMSFLGGTYHTLTKEGQQQQVLRRRCPSQLLLLPPWTSTMVL